MTQCWQEGELRAYLDGELPAGDMERLRVHLHECAACGRLSAELEQRAEWVSSALAALPVPEPVQLVPRFERHSSAGRRWVGAAIALAASLTVALVLLPKAPEKRVVFAPAPQPASPAAPAALPPVTVKPAIIRRLLPRKQAAPSKPKPQLEYYVALDDEPIEAGIVLRVALDGGRVPADVIVGTDGRAHAIRLVSSGTGER
jgi:anti-sigma factor RsiW